MRGCIVYMLHAEELLDIGVNGFLANILMVKDDGHHELQDFQLLQRSLPARGDVLAIELESRTTPVSRFSIPISASRDDRVERAYERFIKQGFYKTKYFIVRSIIIICEEER
ncbi:hypothetical protein YC2023_030582 [Brassica napus]